MQTFLFAMDVWTAGRSAPFDNVDEMVSWSLWNAYIDFAVNCTLVSSVKIIRMVFIIIFTKNSDRSDQTEL